MLYSELNTNQQKCIDAFVRLNPALNTAESISRKEIDTLFEKLTAERLVTYEKIGYPNWLVRNNKISRGVFSFPCPRFSTETAYNDDTSLLNPNNLSEEELAFDAMVKSELLADLNEYGIKPIFKNLKYDEFDDITE